jgi:hypothetical protein
MPLFLVKRRFALPSCITVSEVIRFDQMNCIAIPKQSVTCCGACYIEPM